MAVNMRGTWQCIKSVFPYMRRQRYGKNIFVNAIAPGLVHNDAPTGFNPEEYFAEMVKRRSIARLMSPEDLVGTVIFLASPRSNFISGQTFVIDGGAAIGVSPPNARTALRGGRCWERDRKEGC